MTLSPFFQACGGREEIRLAINGVERAFTTPVIVVGSEPRADVVLPGLPPVAFLFVLFDGHLFAWPLLGEKLLRNDNPFKANWVTQGDEFQIDGCTIRPLNIGETPMHDPLSSSQNMPTDLHFEPSAEFRRRRSSARLSVQPRLMLIGRDDKAKFKINYEGVAPIHALVLRTRSGSWLADLTRRDLTFVNDSSISAARLRDGDKVRFGEVELSACVESAETAMTLAPQAQTQPPSVDEALAPVLNQVAQFQQQTFEQFRELLGSMTQMFSGIMSEHREFVKEEFARMERVSGTTPPAPAVPAAPQLPAAPPPIAARPPLQPFVTPETVTPIPVANGHSAPPPNVELHAWLQDQVGKLEKAETSRWKKLVKKITKD